MFCSFPRNGACATARCAAEHRQRRNESGGARGAWYATIARLVETLVTRGAEDAAVAGEAGFVAAGDGAARARIRQRAAHGGRVVVVGSVEARPDDDGGALPARQHGRERQQRSNSRQAGSSSISTIRGEAHVRMRRAARTHAHARAEGEREGEGEHILCGACHIARSHPCSDPIP